MQITKYLDQYRKDLEFKNYSLNSITNYVSQVKLFLFSFNKIETEPSRINETQIKSWLMESKSINGRKHRISALKLFYKFTITTFKIQIYRISKIREEAATRIFSGRSSKIIQCMRK